MPAMVIHDEVQDFGLTRSKVHRHIKPMHSIQIKEIELSPEQNRVFGAVVKKKNILVTGSAGTGKSTLLDALQEAFGDDLHITASTGIAAVNVSGVTIHRWAGIVPDISAQDVVDMVMKRKGAAFRRIKTAKMLAIDEISMVDASLVDTLDLLFRTVRKSKQPFGGIQMILFGDFLQLPPVKGTGFAFQAKAWIAADIQKHRLTQVFRQKDAFFSGILDQIRLGNVTKEVREALDARIGLKPKGKLRPVAVHSHNSEVDRINNNMLGKIKGEVTEWKSHDYGEAGPLKNIQKSCRAPELLRLKIGAQVMCLWNIAPEDGIANGSIGTVSSITDRVPSVEFSNGMQMDLERCDWQSKESGQVVAGRSQIPLRLAWAITAHKCQGMTLDSIEVFLEDCFDYGQVYVALSRARTLDGLYIGSINYNMIRAHPDALKFYESL